MKLALKIIFGLAFWAMVGNLLIAIIVALESGDMNNGRWLLAMGLIIVVLVGSLHLLTKGDS